MLPKIEIRCFKEKFYNISFLFMKKRTLKSKKNSKWPIFEKILINTGTSPGKPGFQN